MKRRIFYVIHLDRNRILFLLLTFSSLILFSFALGNRLGKSQTDLQKEKGFPLLSYIEEGSGHTINEDIKENEPDKEPPPENSREQPAPKKSESAKVLARPKPQKKPKRQPPPKPITKPAPRPSRQPKTKTQEKPAKQPFRLKPPASAARSAPAKKAESAARKPQAQEPGTLRQGSPKAASSETSSQKLRLSNAPAVRPAQARNIYILQVGAFQLEDAAQRMKTELSQRGFAARVKKNDGLYLVQVGRPDSLTKLEQLERRLRQENYFPVRKLQSSSP